MDLRKAFFDNMFEFYMKRNMTREEAMEKAERYTVAVFERDWTEYEEAEREFYAD